MAAVRISDSYTRWPRDSDGADELVRVQANGVAGLARLAVAAGLQRGHGRGAIKPDHPGPCWGQPLKSSNLLSSAMLNWSNVCAAHLHGRAARRLRRTARSGFAGPVQTDLGDVRAD